jgi:hypothetical protein
MQKVCGKFCQTLLMNRFYFFSRMFMTAGTPNEE